jgi:hypothetical protein
MTLSARKLYTIYAQRLRERSSDGLLAFGMPSPGTKFEVRCSRTGKAGTIQFIPRDLITKPVEAMKIQIRMEYNGSHTDIGMEAAYTLRMLSDEFRVPTPSWNIYPRIC